MTLYFIVKYLHVLGAIVILGTGTGIAFFMLMAHQSRDVAFIARTAATVVIADMLFTLTAVVLQPVTGGLLMALSGTALAERWLVSSLGLYAVAGLFWIPVIFVQIEMRDLARKAVAQGQPLPPRWAISMKNAMPAPVPSRTAAPMTCRNFRMKYVIGLRGWRLVS